MWKLLTGVLAEKIYEHLEERDLLPEEQKGCKRKSWGTKDQLLTDKLIIRNCKRRKAGLGMVWLDYKKAFDMIPHSWILHGMKMFGVPENMIGLLQNSMSHLKTVLTAGNEALGEVNVIKTDFSGR